MITTLIIILFLLLLSALFSCSETALTAASRPLMHALEKEDNDPRAGLVNRLLGKRERLIGTILLGNNLVNILASALATSIMINLFGDAGVAYATAVMTALLLIFGEILPKTLALMHTTVTALRVARIMSILVWLLHPIVSLLQAVVSLTLRFFGASSAGHQSADLLLAELRGAIDLHTEAIASQDHDVRHERAMLKSVLDLADVEVSEIMVHRRNLMTIDADQPVDVIVDQVLTSPHTRIPLWRERPDNIIGILHAKDLLRAVRANFNTPSQLRLDDIASSPWFIPDSTNLLDQLQAFRQRREHFALVVDEYGALQGIVTLEDILEEIVGDIADEHDEPAYGICQEESGTWLINGDVTIRDLNRQFDWSLPDEEAATLAGLLLHETRSIPEQGQVFWFHGFRFEVVERQRNQIVLVRMTPDKPAKLDSGHG